MQFFVAFRSHFRLEIRLDALASHLAWTGCRKLRFLLGHQVVTEGTRGALGASLATMIEGGNMIEDYRLRMHVSYAVSLSTYDIYILVCGLCMLICEAHSFVCMRCYRGDATERSGHEVIKNHPEYQPWGLRNKFSQGYIWNCAVHRVKQ